MKEDKTDIVKSENKDLFPKNKKVPCEEGTKVVSDWFGDGEHTTFLPNGKHKFS